MNAGIVGRDIGVKATFHLDKDDFTMLVLEGGVFNGRGINRGDDNDQKDWVFRACLQPIKGIEFFGNYTFGTHGAGVGRGHDEHQQYSAGFAIEYEGLGVVGECMGLHHHNIFVLDKSMNGYGLYVHLGYKIDTGYDYFHTVEPIVRYEYLDPDTDKHVINDLGKLITCGLNIFIDKNYAKLQLNYIWNINDSGPNRQVADNVFMAQLQGHF